MTKREDQPFDVVERPQHYNSHPSGIETIDVIRHMTLAIGNGVKYMWRTDLKNGLQDLHKARWFLRDAVNTSMPVWALAAHSEARQRLYTVIQFEIGWRRAFFVALYHDDVPEALAAVVKLIEEREAEQRQTAPGRLTKEQSAALDKQLKGERRAMDERHAQKLAERSRNKRLGYDPGRPNHLTDDGLGDPRTCTDPGHNHPEHIGE